MSLQDLGSLGEFVAAIATLVTLIYLALQIRQNTIQQKRDASVSIQQGQNNVVALMQDPKLMRAFAYAGEYGSAAAIEDRAVAINWVCLYLNHFQVVYDVYKEGALDRERYENWKRTAVAIVAPKGIRQWWDEESGKLAFTPELREIIDRELADTSNPPTPMTEAWSILNAKSWEEQASK